MYYFFIYLTLHLGGECGLEIWLNLLYYSFIYLTLHLGGECGCEIWLNLLYYSFIYLTASRWRMWTWVCTCHRGILWGTSSPRWTAMPSWRTEWTGLNKPSLMTSGGSSASWGEAGVVRFYIAFVFIYIIYCFKIYG